MFLLMRLVGAAAAAVSVGWAARLCKHRHGAQLGGPAPFFRRYDGPDCSKTIAALDFCVPASHGMRAFESDYYTLPLPTGTCMAVCMLTTLRPSPLVCSWLSAYYCALPPPSGTCTAACATLGSGVAADRGCTE